MATIAIGALMSVSAHAVTYYVDTVNGNDANNGTSTSTAWKTVSKVNSRTYVGGDIVAFAGGQSHVGSLNFNAGRVTGSSSSSVFKLTSYGTGRATISTPTCAVGIWVETTPGFEIRNINFTGSGRTACSSSRKDGLYFYNNWNGPTLVNHLVIEDVNVTGFQLDGITIGGYGDSASKKGFSNVTINRVNSYNNGKDGIGVWGYFNPSSSAFAHSNVIIKYSKTYDNSGIANWGKANGSGIVISDVNGATIERNVAYNNGYGNNYANGGPVGIWAWDSNAVVIQFNEAYSNKSGTGSLDGGGFDLDGGCRNSYMQYNYSHDNDGAGYLIAAWYNARSTYSNTIRYNISQNDGRKNGYAGIQMWADPANSISGTMIYGNTIYITPAASGTPRAVYLMSPTINTTFYNNIFVTTGGIKVIDIASGQSGIVMKGNDYWSSGSTLNLTWNGTNHTSYSSWRSASGMENTSGVDTGKNVNPGLTSPGGGGTINNPDNLASMTAYRLLSSSPMINAGQTVSSPGSRDYDGTTPLPYNSVFDIGADEYKP